MELVYLWVEEYKNIENEGFNFSPEFTFKYDKATQVLTIDNKREDYVSIFPDNINFTAIVGENGAGKSTLQEIINHTIFEQFEKTSVKNISGYDKVKYEYKNIILFLKVDFEIFPIIAGRIEGIHDKVTSEELKISSKLPFFLTKTNLNTSDKLHLHFFNNINILDFTDNFSAYKFHYHNSGKQGYMTEYDNQILKDTASNNKNLRLSILEKLIFLLHKSKNYFNFIGNDFLFDSIYINFEKNQQEVVIQHYDDYIEDINFSHIKMLNKDFFKNNKTDIKQAIKNMKKNILFDEMNEIVYYAIILICQYYKQKNLDLYNIEILHSKNLLSLNNLSSGEQSIIKIFTEIFYSLEWLRLNHYHSIYMLDEVEITLHPNLQRKFFDYLYKGLEKLKFEKILHVLIATHSPFILSDIPKENVIFLEKGKQVDPNIETFGANIHTLLSHGFFMKEGLTGEFAKEKIQSIIKYHEEIKSKDLQKDDHKQLREIEKEKYLKDFQKSFWNIHSIIGDDFIKQVIKNHLIEIEKILLGNDEAKQEEIKRLEARIALLKS